MEHDGIGQCVFKSLGRRAEVLDSAESLET